MNFVRSHRKAIVAAVAAVLVVFLDEETAKEIAAAVGAVLTYWVPNS